MSKEPKTLWLLIDIGCIECGEDSKPIGLYLTKAEAEKAADLNGGEGSYFESGQHYVEIFEVPAPKPKPQTKDKAKK